MRRNSEAGSDPLPHQGINGSVRAAVRGQGREPLRFTPRHLSGRIGQGGRSLRVTTVNGGIRLRTAP